MLKAVKTCQTAVVGWGNRIADWIIYDPRRPGMPCPRRIMNATAGAVAALAAIGLGTCLVAGRVAYSASDGNLPLSAAVGATWTLAYVGLTRYVVRQTFDLKRYLG